MTKSVRAWSRLQLLENCQKVALDWPKKVGIRKCDRRRASEALTEANCPRTRSILLKNPNLSASGGALLATPGELQATLVQLPRFMFLNDESMRGFAALPLTRPGLRLAQASECNRASKHIHASFCLD
jgi:hypothetical protein